MVLAYEPVGAIGTGKTATPQQVTAQKLSKKSDFPRILDLTGMEPCYSLIPGLFQKLNSVQAPMGFFVLFCFVFFSLNEQEGSYLVYLLFLGPGSA